MLCKCNQTEKWHSSDVKRKSISDIKCRDTSCHVQTLIWELLNGADQVVLYTSIGVCTLTVHCVRSIFKIPPGFVSVSWKQKVQLCQMKFCSNLFEKLLKVAQKRTFQKKVKTRGMNWKRKRWNYENRKDVFLLPGTSMCLAPWLHCGTWAKIKSLSWLKDISLKF